MRLSEENVMEVVYEQDCDYKEKIFIFPDNAEVEEQKQYLASIGVPYKTTEYIVPLLDGRDCTGLCYRTYVNIEGRFAVVRHYYDI